MAKKRRKKKRTLFLDYGTLSGFAFLIILNLIVIFKGDLFGMSPRAYAILNLIGVIFASGLFSIKIWFKK